MEELNNQSDFECSAKTRSKSAPKPGVKQRQNTE